MTAFDWEDLLFYLDDRKIVPVIGRELLKIEVDGEALLLDEYLGRRLAERLKLPSPADSEVLGLSEVALRFLRGGGERSRIYTRLHGILKERPLPVPDSLRKLAEITDLRLFVSTTPDSLLVQALNEVRFGGQDETQTLDYSTKPPPSDLEVGAWRDDGATVVFSLFGRASSLPEYAVTAEDRLEFLTVLQDRDLQPRNLFSVLRESNLLLLGCGLPDWLIRFFVRTVKNERLKDSQGWKFVADDRVRADRDLAVFLELYKTQIFEQGGAEAFVEELHRKWSQARPKGDLVSLEAPVPKPTPSHADIVLSYAREDQERVRELKRYLDGAGLRTWIDEEGIPPATDWDRKIRQTIGRCSVFVPCLSRQAEADRGSFFRREWKAAVERSADFFGSTRRFLWPVVLDDLDETAENIPEEFRKPNWTRASKPRALSRLVEELTAEIRDIRGEMYR